MRDSGFSVTSCLAFKQTDQARCGRLERKLYGVSLEVLFVALRDQGKMVLA